MSFPSHAGHITSYGQPAQGHAPRQICTSSMASRVHHQYMVVAAGCVQQQSAIWSSRHREPARQPLTTHSPDAHQLSILI